MSMQIKSISLYNSSGDIRSLSFKRGSVNIITGKSNTGKSSIIEIIDYCLGQSKFKIPEGVIRDTVLWYAVVYQINGTQVLIAKPTPAGGAASQSRVYYEVSSEISLPPLSKLTANSNDDAIVENLSRLIGISPNINVPEEGESRRPLEATIKHASFYLFQEQSTIANKNVLFHQQQEDYIPQTIKDTLPYFLGAIREDRLKLEQELRSARRNLALAQRRLKEAESIVSERVSKGQTLIAEAQQVGIISKNITAASHEEVLAVLKDAIQWKPTVSPPIADDRLLPLREEVEALRQEFRRKLEQIKAAEAFVKEAEGYSTEGNQQVLRLDSIKLFESLDSLSDTCPLCSSKTAAHIPQLDAMKEQLSSLEANLRTVEREQPKLREYIQRLKDEQEMIRGQIEEKEMAIEAVLEEQKAAQEMRDANARIARVVGRISLYLDTVELTDERSPLRKEMKNAQELVEYYEKQLDTGEIEETKTSILNLVGMQMTEWAKKLNLEHSGFPYRLDLNRLTVVADRSERPIPMDRMGGGENWLGCHLISHLALHKLFIERGRPVPNFLILDQPTQVYFPSFEKYKALEGTTEGLKAIDADMFAVERMFNLLFDLCKSLFPNLQIIVLEHANLDDKKFQEALVEEPWRGGKALVPEDWISS